MRDQDSQMAANGIIHASSMAFTDVSIAMMRPYVLMRPRIYIDGNQWCALYGDNLQDGVAGFGSTPDEAMREFDRNWETQKAILAKSEEK